MSLSAIKNCVSFLVLSLFNTLKYKVFNYNSFNMLTLEEICGVLKVNPDSVENYGRNKNKRYYICQRKMLYLKRSIMFSNMIEDDALADVIVRQGGIIISDTSNRFKKQITVENEREAYIQLCSKCRRDQTFIIAVTGSTGKTSAKQFLNHVVKAHKKTFCATQNMNTIYFIGTLLQLSNKKNEVIVQEVDEGDPELVGVASRMLRPDIAVITNVGVSHMQNFGSQEGIVDNIAEIEDHMGSDAIVIYNYDDTLLKKHQWVHKAISVSVKDELADCFCSEYKVLDNGHIAFKIVYDGKSYEFEIPIPGEHNLYNAMYAFLCGTILGEDKSLTAKQLLSFKTTGVRQNTLKSKKSLLYVDCFNAAPDSVKTAVNAICSLSGYNKKIAVLSDMFELGDESDNLHREVGKYIQSLERANCPDVVLCYGNSAKFIADEIKRNDIDVLYSDERANIESELRRYTNKGNAFLFKGSRGMHMEKFVKAVFPFAYLKVFLSDVFLFNDI